MVGHVLLASFMGRCFTNRKCSIAFFQDVCSGFLLLSEQLVPTGVAYHWPFLVLSNRDCTRVCPVDSGTRARRCASLAVVVGRGGQMVQHVPCLTVARLV